MNDQIYRQQAIDAVISLCDDCDSDYCGSCRVNFPGEKDCRKVLEDLPSAQPEWNNHTVACLLADLFGDSCACNYNGIDEWLPEKCELLDACPNPVGVACWEQYLKHRAERREE